MRGERGTGLHHAVGVRESASGRIERRRSRDGATGVVQRASAGVDRDVAPGHRAGLVAQARGRQRNVLRGEQLAACVGDRAGAGDRQVAAAGAEHAAGRVVQAGNGGVEVAGSGDRAALVYQIAGLDRGRPRCGNRAVAVVELARARIEIQAARRNRAALVAEAGGGEGGVLRGNELALGVGDTACTVDAQLARAGAERAAAVVQVGHACGHVARRGQRAAVVDEATGGQVSRTGGGDQPIAVVERAGPGVHLQIARREGAALVAQARNTEGRILRGNQLAACVDDIASAVQMQAGRLRAERARRVVQAADLERHVTHGGQRAAPVDQRAGTDGSRTGGGHRTASVVEQTAPRVQRQVARRDRAGLVAQARGTEGCVPRGDQLASRVVDGTGAGHAQAGRLRAERAAGVVQAANVGLHIRHRSQHAPLVDQAARIDRRRAGRGHRALGVVDRAAARIQPQVARRHHPALAVQAGGRDRSILRGDQLAARIDDIASAVHSQAGRLRAERARGVVQAADLQRHVTHGSQRAAPVDQRSSADGSRAGGGHRTAGVIDPAVPRVD